MNFLNNDWRYRRHFPNQGISFVPMQYNIANYSTDTEIHKKTDMKQFEEEIFTKIHTIPDPLKKNLADTVITCDNKEKIIETPIEGKEFYYEANLVAPTAENMEISSTVHRRDFYPTLNAITGFISNVFGTISGAMFNRRPRSPVSQYFDCFECNSHITQEMASENWQPSNMVDQNKSAQNQSGASNYNMNNCRAAVAQCEDKISAVKDLLQNKTVPQSKKNTKVHYRRPKRAFIEPGAVTEGYEEDSSAEDYVSLANDEYIEYFAIPNNRNQEFCEIEAPKMKIELNTVEESTDIVKTLPDVPNKVQISTPIVINSVEPETDVKTEVIASCEDKLAKLKAILLEKRKKPSRSSIQTDSNEEIEKAPAPAVEAPAKQIQLPTIIEPAKEVPQRPFKPTKVIPIEKKHDKRYKNLHRLTDKRKKTKLKKRIQDDMVFANEIDSDDLSSVENSPSTISTIQETLPIVAIQSDNEYFDEVKGRFHSASTDSDDSFQIVFSESPKHRQMRRPSECDSEDSFIVFEDSPDSCFTSNDVFGDNSLDDSDISDDESDVSDSGCAVDICKLSHSFSKTVSDLTDNSLYDDTQPIEDTSIVEEIHQNDEVDCAVRTINNILVKELSPVKEESPEKEEIDCVCESGKSGLLIDEAKKLRRKNMAPKKVTFSEQPPKVHVMRVWAFAARQARAGHWERYTVDRERFKRRIADVDMAISWVLKPQHRSRVMFQRFMPWWNKLKRQEAAERKQREAEEKIRQEEERIKMEREAIIEEDIVKEIDSINMQEDDVVEHFKKVIEDLKLERLKIEKEIEEKNRAKQQRREAAKKDRERRRLEAEKRYAEQSAAASNVSPKDGSLTLKCR